MKNNLIIIGSLLAFTLIISGCSQAEKKEEVKENQDKPIKTSVTVKTEKQITPIEPTKDEVVVNDKTSITAEAVTVDDTKQEEVPKSTPTPAPKEEIIPPVTTPIPTPEPTPAPEKIAEEPKKEEPKPKSMEISISAFSNESIIPAEYTCTGVDTNPAINISNIPSTAKSLALIVDDPDAPNGTWDHWILYDITPTTAVISKGSTPTGAKIGFNSWGNAEWGGPCPPSGTHRYFFKLYALDKMLGLDSADSYDLGVAMKGHIVAQTSYMGKFSK